MMPNKKIILVFLLGWSLAIFLPPQKVFGMFGGRGNS